MCEYDSSGNLSSDDYTLRTSNGHEVKMKDTYDGDTWISNSSQKVLGGYTDSSETITRYTDQSREGGILYQKTTSTRIDPDNNIVSSRVTELIYDKENNKNYQIITDNDGIVTATVYDGTIRTPVDLSEIDLDIFRQ